MNQIGIKKITGKIVVKTGLHIGCGNDTVEIGGIDNPIVRNPFTREPYIPGSSLKGKMRSLLEWKEGKVISADGDGKPCSCGKAECPICRVFGCANKGESKESDKSGRGPTRIIVRDAFLTEDWREKFRAGRTIIEEKHENNIDRINAKATPRSLERVVPGVEFSFEIDYRVIDTGDDGKTDEDMFNSVVKEGLRLLQSDFLGGGGSRGNGQIAFAELKDENGNEISL